jgi:hypothetical protein
MTRWASRAPRSSLAALAELRGAAGIEAGESGDYLWLVGSQLTELLEQKLRKVPGAELFTVNEDNELVPRGARIPRGYLVACDWASLKSFIAIHLPAATVPARAEINPVALRLVPSAQERASTHLLVEVDAWTRWVESAPLARLQCVQFAASADGQILVAGDPLPTLSGTHLWAEAGVVVPAGWEWLPRVSALTVRRAIGAAEDHTVIWLPESGYELLHASDFVVARRAAVRATAEALHVRT